MPNAEDWISVIEFIIPSLFDVPGELPMYRELKNFPPKRLIESEIPTNEVI